MANTLRINATDELALNGVPDTLLLDGQPAGLENVQPSLGVTMTVVLKVSGRRQPVVCIVT